jgi:hypothetical protein
MIRYLLPAALLLCLACSKPSEDKGLQRAFYFWQTSLNNFDWGDSAYQALHVNRVYLRMFDVDWDEGMQMTTPVSPLQFYYSYWDKDTEAVPVVFITNRTFKQLTKEQSVELAHQVHRKVVNMMSSLLNAHQVPYNEHYDSQSPYRVLSKDFREQAQYDSAYRANMTRIKQVQFDCDWTESTREKYFAFLEESVRLFDQQLVSSTVRLYQYKYPDKAGVPPVKRGMLMCYNAGNIKDPETKNSIFDVKEVKSYLEGSDYDLPLDYALPTFEWAVLFQQGKFASILSAEDLRANYADYLSEPQDGVSQVTQDFVYGSDYSGIYIRYGDEIRFETADLRDVQEIASWLSSHKNNKDAVLTLYHLNTYDLQKHSKEIESIFSSF